MPIGRCSSTWMRARTSYVGQCSTGYLARPLVERGCTVVGIEFDEAAADVARDVCEEVLVGNVESSSFRSRTARSTSSSAGTSSSTCATRGRFLERVRPLLRRGGRLVLTTPNVANWTIRLALLVGPLALHGAGHPRSHARAPLHAEDARRRSSERATASSPSTSRRRFRWSGRRPSRPLRARDRSHPAVALRVPVRRRGDPT